MTSATPILDRTPIMEEITTLSPHDLEEICSAAEAAIEDGGGFGWLKIPERSFMERFWQGVVASPFRRLFVARLDGTICAALQLVRYPNSNEAQKMSTRIVNFFVVPWARSYGVGRQLVEFTEHAARADGYMQLQLDVRRTQVAAIGLFSSLGFKRWGENPHYAHVDGDWVTGYYYGKLLITQESETK